MIYLQFSPGKQNSKLAKLQSKLGKIVYSFSIMSGHNCPYAHDCHSRAVIQDDGRWKIEDGKYTLFRCFSASQEVLFPALRQQRINNMQLVEVAAKSVKRAVDTILYNLPSDCEVLRIHVGGDFRTKPYMKSWVEAARQTPSVLFYAYTKSIPFWLALQHTIPENMVLNASWGGKCDGFIEQYKLQSARVYLYANEVPDGMPIDDDDSHATIRGGDFALIIHGSQPAGTDAAKAVAKQRKGAK